MSTLGEKDRIYVISERVARACGRASDRISDRQTNYVGLHSRKLLGILCADPRKLTE